MPGEQGDTRKIYLYKGSDAVKVFKTIQIDISFTVHDVKMISFMYCNGL